MYKILIVLFFFLLPCGLLCHPAFTLSMALRLTLAKVLCLLEKGEFRGYNSQDIDDFRDNHQYWNCNKKAWGFFSRFFLNLHVSVCS